MKALLKIFVSVYTHYTLIVIVFIASNKESCIKRLKLFNSCLSTDYQNIIPFQRETGYGCIANSNSGSIVSRTTFSVLIYMVLTSFAAKALCPSACDC